MMVASGRKFSGCLRQLDLKQEPWNVHIFQFSLSVDTYSAAFPVCLLNAKTSPPNPLPRTLADKKICLLAMRMPCLVGTAVTVGCSRCNLFALGGNFLKCKGNRILAARPMGSFRLASSMTRIRTGSSQRAVIPQLLWT
jgi:hypothetical protein